MISIIMPTYNRAPLLVSRLAEFYVQTYKNWELIIVNDCSTDSTFDFLNTIDDPKIKIIHLKKNSGCVSIPRNIGITLATGEYIFHADDDDIHHKDALETLHSLLSNNPEAILAYGDRFVQRNGTKAVVRTPNWNPTLPQGWGVGNGQFMYRKNCYNSIPLVFCKRACDWRLCSKLYSLGKFIYTPKVILTVIWHSNNRSLDETTKLKEIDIEHYKEYFSKFKINEIKEA